MQHIPGLMQRKALLAAGAAFCAGCALIIWMLVGAFAPPAQAEPLPDDIALIDEEPADEQAAPALDEELEQPASAPEPLIVYISGAVLAPDVYRLPAGARVKDLVVAAGGFEDTADQRAVNLAAHLSDAQHIHIPRHGEAEAPQAAAEPSAGEAGAAPADGAPIDLNSASAADLDELPGIGSAIAERIVAYREANGPFQSVEDLGNVKGIGPALLERITPLVTIGA